MLEHLHIKNVALIKESEISFGEGLNILTGETGAGKSMVIDSLQFALGGRAGKDFLRHGEKQASVEALFAVQSSALQEKLEENGIESEEDGSVLITRTLSETGKSVCRVNGSTVTVSMLKEIAEDLIDIYGQHEHQSLLNPEKHIETRTNLIKTIEEALITIPRDMREASLALGASKVQTIFKIVLPSCIGNIISAIILGMGRIISESAPLILTAGMVYYMPKNIFSSSRTLTTHLYYLASEGIGESAKTQAYATAAVLVMVIIILNIITRYIGKKLCRK